MDFLGETCWLVDEQGERWSRNRLDVEVDRVAEDLGRVPPGPIFVHARNDVATVITILGALSSQRAVGVLPPFDGHDAHRTLYAKFRPALVLTGSGPSSIAGYRHASVNRMSAWERLSHDHPGCHPDLQLLLTTSGSTGSPKLVRLSTAAVRSNSSAIVTALGIVGADVAITSLPLAYTYGLSVLLTHLRAGAGVVLSGASVTDRGFWSSVEEHAVTTLAGVPRTYAMLRAMRWRVEASPSVRTLTQAGGRLDPEVAAWLRATLRGGGVRFHVMYGQTEATARITILPAHEFHTHPDAVGFPIDGRVEIESAPSATDGSGRVVLFSPSVMMGYAESAEDLLRGDELRGRLATGDLGRLDSEGRLYLTGREKRIAKVSGIRIDLDDLELLLREDVDAIVSATEAEQIVVAVVADAKTAAGHVNNIARRLGLRRDAFLVRAVDQIPLLSNGKPDYSSLRKESTQS
ncbi:AMP-binding protein [Microbacterium enclense]|uniref:AMP-binding protein n=1 Tax=Microbacterium enclense TaxID=993073 RepID=UPI003F819023